MAVSGEALVPVIFPGTGRSYDRVVRWTTLGLDARWKRRLIEGLPPSKNVLELASGTGILTAAILEKCPEARWTGVDITDDYMHVGRERFAASGRDLDFRLGDAVTVPVADRGPFDAVVSCYIPKYVSCERLVAHLTPSMAPGGVLRFHDFTKPRGVFPWAVWRSWFGLLNLITPFMHPEWRRAFDSSLTELISTSHWVNELRTALLGHGWADIEVTRLHHRAATIVSARRPG